MTVQRWQTAGITVPEGFLICENHFDADDFTNASDSKRLKFGVVPTKNLALKQVGNVLH